MAHIQRSTKDVAESSREIKIKASIVASVKSPILKMCVDNMLSSAKMINYLCSQLGTVLAKGHMAAVCSARIKC